jgi:hypothetical protein
MHPSKGKRKRSAGLGQPDVMGVTPLRTPLRPLYSMGAPRGQEMKRWNAVMYVGPLGTFPIQMVFEPPIGADSV